ncbi:sensor histidine kinase [Wenxinia saemankumensis]|uniref:histidine kinase n=1 Tax=Wenxinia saemankumensis TaxID=1447782 RepID=A0A1M6ADH4_9RHOB|nr:HAMP domain-containing sensor histidine kinase [Wenxinia saemankumensis]SHI34472.1 Signal transduction histidine kinase [Wenxinia saemankumensis]
MSLTTWLRAGWQGWFDPVGREQEIREYSVLLTDLTWKRLATFVSSFLLSAIYFDPFIAFVFIVPVLVSEFFDQRLGVQARKWDGGDVAFGRRILRRITLNTILSATSISCFLISIAVQQHTGGHFTPLFFLFSGAIFAAMYTSQLLGILILRLSIYAVAFIVIASLDVIRYYPPLSSPVWLEFFTIVLVMYFVADISWQFYQSYRRGLEQMKMIEKEAEAAKAALVVKSQFVSIVSHELRTPLTSIKGSIDLINSGRTGELSPKTRSLLDIAGRNSQRLALLIDDLLDLQKMESGEMSFRLEPLDLHETVRDAIESTTGFASKFGIHVETRLEAPGCRIMGDHDRLVQALQNLLSNAMKFSREGGTVTVTARTDGSRARVSVRDTGVGIPDGAEDRVFGKFTQVDSSEKRKVGGTGLGLNITKQIAERHNATIRYESKLGVGTVFFLEFESIADSRPVDDGAAPSRPVNAQSGVDGVLAPQ